MVKSASAFPRVSGPTDLSRFSCQSCDARSAVDVGRTDVTLDRIAAGSVSEPSTPVKARRRPFRSFIHTEVGRPSTNPKTNPISSPITYRIFSSCDSQSQRSWTSQSKHSETSARKETHFVLGQNKKVNNSSGELSVHYYSGRCRE